MTRRLPLKEEYFKYLYNIVRPLPRTYYKLCQELHNKKFRWFIRNDDNRCEDGLHLRELYIDEQGLDESHLEVQGFNKGDCTLFEVMVALAQRMDYELSGLIQPRNRTNKYFFEMLKNLKLDVFSDSNIVGDGMDPISECQIEEILENLLDRTYGYDGDGSLFPLKFRGPKDMAKVEIWYQMMLYINENYS
jgi:hypothetical protein